MRARMALAMVLVCWGCDDGETGAADGSVDLDGGGEGGEGGAGGQGGAGGVGGQGGAGGVGGMGGAGGEGGEGGEGGMGGMACAGENPQGCFGPDDCPSDAICDLDVEECIPTACECGEDGEWACTPDCGGGRCVPPDDCEGPNPGGDEPPGCAFDHDCAEGDVCDMSDCLPVPCVCIDGEWACSDACGGQCRPAACDGPNPGGTGEDLCFEDAQCGGDGWTCDLDACEPLPCDCVDGDWMCPDACGGRCVPPLACVGVNPAGCVEDTDCDLGAVCSMDGDDCRPSFCECADGEWVCDADCGGGNCIPGPECDDPNPQGCSFDADCVEQGGICDQAICSPSACECTPAGWLCTDDCIGTCTGGACAGPNPQGCTQPTDCASGEVCQVDPAECLSSGCLCDEESGQWICLPDCGGGRCVAE